MALMQFLLNLFKYGCIRRRRPDYITKGLRRKKAPAAVAKRSNLDTCFDELAVKLAPNLLADVVKLNGRLWRSAKNKAPLIVQLIRVYMVRKVHTAQTEDKVNSGKPIRPRIELVTVASYSKSERMPAYMDPFGDSRPVLNKDCWMYVSHTADGEFPRLPGQTEFALPPVNDYFVDNMTASRLGEMLNKSYLVEERSYPKVGATDCYEAVKTKPGAEVRWDKREDFRWLELGGMDDMAVLVEI